jgi:aminoglycoside 3-N-acetyltransferase
MDAVRIALEISERQIYFRSRWLMRTYGRRRRRAPAARQECTVAQLREYLKLIGIVPGVLAMLHTSVRNVSLIAGDGQPSAEGQPAGAASRLLGEVMDLVGDTGTLVMPTHPLYSRDPGYHSPGNKSDLILDYDPHKTPCQVGLANEIFRQLPGTQRSLHPLQSVSARGPRAADILRNNLNRSKPLPHGADSSYYRVCTGGGIVVGFGIPLIEYLTLIHVAEDIRDADWPVNDFYRERRFRVRINEKWEEWTVRERRPLFARSYCEGQIHRDLLREGLLHEGHVGTIRVDWANAGEVLEFLLYRNKGNSYPYYFTSLAKLGA